MEPTAELIALLDENSELMPDGVDAENRCDAVHLAQKLMALDLPKPADPLLVKLIAGGAVLVRRVQEFGATLATLRLREGDADGALLALSESNSADMDDAVRGSGVR